MSHLAGLVIVFVFIYFTIKLESRLSAGAPYWITSVIPCPGVRCLEEPIWRNELSIAK